MYSLVQPMSILSQNETSQNLWVGSPSTKVRFQSNHVLFNSCLAPAMLIRSWSVIQKLTIGLCNEQNKQQAQKIARKAEQKGHNFVTYTTRALRSIPEKSTLAHYSNITLHGKSQLPVSSPPEASSAVSLLVLVASRMSVSVNDRRNSCSALVVTSLWKMELIACSLVMRGMVWCYCSRSSREKVKIDGGSDVPWHRLVLCCSMLVQVTAEYRRTHWQPHVAAGLIFALPGLNYIAGAGHVLVR